MRCFSVTHRSAPGAAEFTSLLSFDIRANVGMDFGAISGSKQNFLSNNAVLVNGERGEGWSTKLRWIYFSSANRQRRVLVSLTINIIWHRRVPRMRQKMSETLNVWCTWTDGGGEVCWDRAGDSAHFMGAYRAFARIKTNMLLKLFCWTQRIHANKLLSWMLFFSVDGGT